ncbi:hypothetical protein [Mesorhizobium sp. B2-8-5]|uniref:hypothetical protein n=1 Tax=Mesorhizobium sp. B2-8-5 TaxID=2589903 RepID=UPI0015E27267|nr:hypothetical protein [Mesorhizobium sp. B2-8-5]UCI26745.1 hypothetical protein FJ430_03865 [Mesorhizobium sp. B2-8-5]
MSMAICRSSPSVVVPKARGRHVRLINAANKNPPRKQGSGSVETEYSKGDGDDYAVAEDRMSMFCSAKYNSMNCFTLYSVCQQNKGRMVSPTLRPNRLGVVSGKARAARLPFVGAQDFHRSFP